MHYAFLMRPSKEHDQFRFGGYILKLLALILALSLPSFASASQCLFGPSTWDLEENFEQPSGARVFYKGEFFALSKPQRLNGLSETEKALIQSLMEEKGDGAEALKEFSLTDGYLMYFSHAPTGRQFIQVAHFPGDNENGAVFEISVKPQGVDVLGKAAQISDGAFDECRL